MDDRADRLWRRIGSGFLAEWSRLYAGQLPRARMGSKKSVGDGWTTCATRTPSPDIIREPYLQPPVQGPEVGPRVVGADRSFENPDQRQKIEIHTSTSREMLPECTVDIADLADTEGMPKHISRKRTGLDAFCTAFEAF